MLPTIRWATRSRVLDPGSDWSSVITPIPREHVLFIHAHPDDESITTGGTMATLIVGGASVTLLTCTRGELGEVIPAELRHLSGNALGEYRSAELAEAVSVIGLSDSRFLGGERARAEGAPLTRYRDSGMQWGVNGPEPLETKPEVEGDTVSLTSARLETLVADVCAVIADVQPTAVVSYNSRGGYGHPDHVRTHDIAGIASAGMGVPFYTIVSADEAQTGDLQVDVSHVMDRKRRALQAYRTQLTVTGDAIVHSGGQSEPITSVEAFRRDGAKRAPAFDWRQLKFFSKTIGGVLACAMGAILGVVGTLNHQFAFGALSLLLLATFLVGLRLLTGVRTLAVWAAVGMLVMVGIFSLKSPGGSVLIQNNAAGYIWTYALPLIALIVLAWPNPLRRTRDSMEKETVPEKVVAAS